jgi:hypothetical protein
MARLEDQEPDQAEARLDGVKILFSALHFAGFRNFESAIGTLVERGHHVHLSADERESLGGQQLVERLAAAYPGQVTWDYAPSLTDEPWYDAASRLRVGLDYVRFLDRRYREVPKLRTRASGRTPRVIRGLAAVPGARGALNALLCRIERLMPRSAAAERYLRDHAPDVVLLASLTVSRSQQLDHLKAARVLRIPVGACVMSWDHLSSKALLHIVPDLVVVWNDVQRREAVEMHAIPADRVAVTGAQCYDEWFTRAPARTRDEFCREMGLRPDRPFVLYVHSALTPMPDPPEPQFVRRWIDALRRSADPRLREAGVLVRPHPERIKEWHDVSLDGFDNVAFHGANPIDARAKADYFDSLYHSSAVVGIVTSAFLEAAIVGRPVLTIARPEYRTHQAEMIHFQYLTTVAGGVLRTAASFDEHHAHLLEAFALEGRRDDRNRRFLEAFIRPNGLHAPATPTFVDAVERLASRQPLAADPSLTNGAWLRALVAALAIRAHGRVGRWLLMDDRDADAEALERERERLRQGRIDAHEAYRRDKMQARERRQRAKEAHRRGKSRRRFWRQLRHDLVVRYHRGRAGAARFAQRTFGASVTDTKGE